MDASWAIDQLSTYYTNHSLPAIFLEQNQENRIGNRYERFYIAFTTGGATDTKSPWVMADGGHRWDNGPAYYYDEYKAMVDAELARPAQAEISATGKRINNYFEFNVSVKNLSGVRLSATNFAYLTVIVYEDTDVGLTSHFDRDVVNIPIDLANGATGNYTLNSNNLSGVNWDKLNVVAVVEYRPTGEAGAYDMLQAAMVPLATLTIQPAELPFLIDPFAPGDKTATVNIKGLPSTLVWSASTNKSWLSVTPATGTVGVSGTNAQVRLDYDTLGNDTSATVTFTASYGGKQLSQVIPVYVAMSAVKLYMPVIQR